MLRSEGPAGPAANRIRGSGQDRWVEAGSDAQIIAASRVEPLVFAAVFDRHYDAVHRYLARRVGSDLADDLAAETFTTAFDVRRRYDTARPDARPWLFGIATNLLRHHHRGEARRLRAYARLDRPADGVPGILAGRTPISSTPTVLWCLRPRASSLPIGSCGCRTVGGRGRRSSSDYVA